MTQIEEFDAVFDLDSDAHIGYYFRGHVDFEKIAGAIEWATGEKPEPSDGKLTHLHWRMLPVDNPESGAPQYKFIKAKPTDKGAFAMTYFEKL